MDLTDVQWALLEPLFPRKQTQPSRLQGRPWKPAREVLNGILWVLRTGAPWHDLPDKYPPYQTCHRRFQGWVHDGTFERIIFALAKDLRDRGDVDLAEAFIDATFVVAKKGGPLSGKQSAARDPRSWLWSTLLVLLSPPTLRVLRRPRSPSLRTPLMTLSWPSLPSG